jgi:hypothetical protein
MNTKILGLLAVALLVGPIVANAQADILDYQGAPLTVVSSTPLIIPPGYQLYSNPFISSLGTDPISGFIGLDTPLPVNGTTAGNGALEIGGISMGVTSAEFVTTNGVLTSWSVSASDSAGGPGGYWELDLTVTSTGDSFNGSQDVLVYNPITPYFLVPEYTAILSDNSTPGTLTTQAPEIDPASAASGLTLLLGSIVVLRGRRAKLTPSV